jgi:transcriptional regulator GlxA family with amidase domain
MKSAPIIVPHPPDPTIEDGPLRRVVMLIYPGVTPLDISGPLEVFSFANRLTKKKLYDIITVAPTAEPVPTGLGFAFLPACAMTDLAGPIDTLLVGGGAGPHVVHPPEIFDWLKRTAPRARRFGSICTGAFVLGTAGLLDGKRVTTHWELGGELAKRNPATQVEIDSIYVRDGKLCTSAGISAGIDLALALLEEDHGRALALKVARYLVLFLKRSGGQTQFSTVLQSQFSSIPAIEQVQHWCHNNLGGDLRVSTLAKKAAMSERNFIRAFREDTGRTPAEFVASIRLQAARRMLEETELAPKAIAKRCGLGAAAAMRRVFLRELGVSPADYRDKFQAKAAAPALRAAAAAPVA